MTFKILDNTLPNYYCEKTHKYAEMSNQWHEGGTDLLKSEVKENHSTFPMMPVIRDGETQQWHPFCGWFMCIGQMLADIAMREYNIKRFDHNLHRVHLVAHRPGEKGTVVPHRDQTSEYCSVVYHLSQFPWRKEWGGSTFIADEEIEFVPNRAIIFRSDIPHYGTPPNPICPHSRIILNVLFRVGDTLDWRSKTI
jgi:hypothetical protein